MEPPYAGVSLNNNDYGSISGWMGKEEGGIISMTRQRLLTRIGAAGMLLCAALATLSPHGARAMTTYCRSDPVVTFTGSGLLSLVNAYDLSATIGDSLSDVQQVTYVVHAPVGSHLLAVVNTDSLIGLKEKVVFYADDTAGRYDTYTTVTTGQRGVSVTATALVISLSSLGTFSASGSSGQILHIKV